MDLNNVLARFAAKLRQSDFAGMLEDDRFAILLRQTNREDTAAGAVALKGQPKVTLGVAVFPEDGEETAQLLRLVLEMQAALPPKPQRLT